MKVFSFKAKTKSNFIGGTHDPFNKEKCISQLVIFQSLANAFQAQTQAQTTKGGVVHLVERGAALPAFPQTRGLQALEDSGEGTAGPVSPRTGAPAHPRHAAACRHS